MQKKIDLRDLGSERSLLATVIQGGKDAYIDASSIVSAKDLALPINKGIFNSVQSLVDDPNCVSIDPETIKTKMGILGYGEMLKDSKNLEYLETICRYGSNPKNLNLFALQVRKFSVARELLSKHEDSIKFLSELKGTEKISDIIKNSEEMINDYLVGANDLSSSQYMAEGIDQYIANLIENDPVDQIGIPTGFPLWDNAVGGHRKAAISIVVSRSKCVSSKDTFIFTNLGMLTPLELHQDQIDCKPKYDILGMDGNLHSPKLWFNSGETPTIKFRTSRGFDIEVTHNHPLLILNKFSAQEWKLAKDIKYDDYLILRRGDLVFGSSKIDDLDAYVYGCICGDGHLPRKGAPYFSITTMDSYIKKECFKFAKKYDLRIRKNKKIGDRAADYHFRNPSKIKDLKILRDNFYENDSKIMPRFIRESDQKTVSIFLRGLFDTDGCVERKKMISIAMKGETLARQVRSMLMNFGILSNCKKRMIKIPNKNIRKPYYYITIMGVQNVLLFHKYIGFGLKRKQLLLERAILKDQRIKFDTIPYASYLLRNTIDNIRKFHDVIFSQLIDPRCDDCNAFFAWIREARKPTRDHLLLLANKYSDKIQKDDLISIKKIADQHLFYDRIVSVKHGKCITSDYQIPEGNSFIANSIISHNCGKSWNAMNIARNVGKKKIPVLYLDTEMTKGIQQARLLSIDSGCPIKLLETSQFKHSDEYRNSVIESGKNIQDYSITYQNVSGVTHTEAMTMIKRWLTKTVGFDGRGKANECLIIYDYIKLVSGENIASNMPEYMLLFLVMTDLHNFAVKYEIPIIGFVQANREGIDIEDSRIIAGSDRILWLCSSMSLLKNKTQQDIEEGGSNWQAGNKKLMVIDTRYGPGIDEFDYINLKASIRPNVNEREATGLFVEGEKHSTVVYDARRDNKDSEPKDRVSVVGARS